VKSILKMGSVESKFDALPVTGHSTGLGILAVNGQHCIRPETTVLILQEEWISYTSGYGCSIKDINGTKWFQIQGGARESAMRGKRSQSGTMQDINGQEVCGYQKKGLSTSTAAHITINNGTMVVASIIRDAINRMTNLRPRRAEIFVHNPPVPIDNVTTVGVPELIRIEGDIMHKNYDFMMGAMNTNPDGSQVAGSVKIAQVVRTSSSFSSYNDTYSLEIGPNVDIAFMCVCTSAVDELFRDNK